MKNVILLLMALFIANNAYSFCLFGHGDDCPETTPKENQVNIFNGALGIGTPVPEKKEVDGGVLRKQEAGDKSKNQGYSTYKEHAIYYSYEFYAVPHQEGFKKSSGTDNRSIAYEYNFNPYLSAKLQKMELSFEGTSGGDMKQEHLFATFNLRLYILNNFVVRTGIGLGKSNIDSSSDDSRYNYATEGTTEVLQFSVNYLFGNEDTFVGVSTTTLQGVSGDRNLGTSSYGLSAGLGF
jgi:hypothetical protein